MVYSINVIMDALSMFKEGGNDLIGEAQEQLMQDIIQNQFSDVVDMSSKDPILDDLYDSEDDYDTLCNLIDDDISDDSKFWNAVTILPDTLEVRDDTHDCSVISYWVDADIDMDKLVRLYLG